MDNREIDKLEKLNYFLIYVNADQILKIKSEFSSVKTNGHKCLNEFRKFINYHYNDKKLWDKSWMIFSLHPELIPKFYEEINDINIPQNYFLKQIQNQLSKILDPVKN